MTGIPDHILPILRDSIMPLEGGYTAGKVSNGRVIDPETLFGMTIDEWQRVLPTMGPDELNQLTPAMQLRVRDIQQTKPKKQEARVSAFMKDIGRMLEPMGSATEQPATGIPLRSTCQPLSMLSADDRASVESIQAITHKTYYKDYIVAPGFDRYPPALVEHAVKFAINAGEGRARWAMVKAMTEAGIIKPGDARFPNVASTEAAVRETFAEGNKGFAYTSRTMTDNILEAFSHATPNQISLVGQQFPKWVMTYYKALGPEFADNLEGWRNRVYAKPATPTALSPGNPALASIDSVLAAHTVSIGTPPEVIPPILVQATINPWGKSIAIEIPDRGVVTYNVDDKNNVKGDDVTTKPTGVDYWPRGMLTITIGDQTPSEVSSPHLLTWTDKNGNQREFELTRDFNKAVLTAATPIIMDSQQPILAPRIFDLTPDGKHLEGENTDKTFLQGDRLSVMDTRNGQMLDAGPSRTPSTLVPIVVAKTR